MMVFMYKNLIHLFVEIKGPLTKTAVKRWDSEENIITPNPLIVKIIIQSDLAMIHASSGTIHLIASNRYVRHEHLRRHCRKKESMMLKLKKIVSQHNNDDGW